LDPAIAIEFHPVLVLAPGESYKTVIPL
jgi:hypothetical protein